MVETISDLGEFGLIERLRRVLSQDACTPAGLELGIGDDAALLHPNPGCQWVVTCDVLVEGRHFLPAVLRGSALGRRAMAANLSDLAAMGAQPRFAFAALGLRGDTEVAEVEGWYRGFAAALNPWEAGVAGGNMSRVEGAQFLAITLMGEVKAGKALRRDGARPGHAVLVTGCPGQAAAGLRLLQTGRRAELAGHPLVRAYLEPEARVLEAKILADRGLLSAAIDTSDGFLGDLGHLCSASGVGARLWADQLPISPALREAAAAWGEDAVGWFLGPSDDYELILTCDLEHIEVVGGCLGAVSQVPVHQVGVLTDLPGILELECENGSLSRLGAHGWDHFARGGKEP